MSAEPLVTVVILRAAADVVDQGATTTLAGRLEGAEPLDQRSLSVWRSPDGAAWQQLAAVVTGADGSYNLAVAPEDAWHTTHFKVEFAGSQSEAPSSAEVSVSLRPLLTAPGVPQRVGRGTSFTVNGELRPQHAAGVAVVVIDAYRLESANWVRRQTSAAVVAAAVDSSTYSAVIALPSAGSWRLQARHEGACHMEAASVASAPILVGGGPDAPIWNRDGVTTAPERMASRLNSRELVLVTGRRLGSRDGFVGLYRYRDGDWLRVSTVPARFGSRGLTNGRTRRAGTRTTPTGIWRLPAFGFGTHRYGPSTMRLKYRRITRTSWWSAERNSTYNTWIETRRRVYGEHLADYPRQYEFAISSGYNAKPNPQVHGRGAAIFIHVHGRGYTAGCISVSRIEMARLLGRLHPELHPVCAVGTTVPGTATSYTVY